LADKMPGSLFVKIHRRMMIEPYASPVLK